MLLQLCVGALRVAFERRGPPNSSIERGHVLGPLQIMHFVENLLAFDFDLAQALIHRTHAGVVSEWVVVRRSGGCIDRHRGQAVAKRVHPRTRLALWTAGAAAFCVVALVRRVLPLRRHGLTFATPIRRRPAQRWPFLPPSAVPGPWLSRSSPDRPGTRPGAFVPTQSGARSVPRRAMRVGMLQPRSHWAGSRPSQALSVWPLG